MRLVLGLFEAGYFPGVVYLISTWYSRYDMQKRYAGFYALGLVASGCSGILAFGLMQLVSPSTKYTLSGPITEFGHRTEEADSKAGDGSSSSLVL